MRRPAEVVAKRAATPGPTRSQLIVFLKAPRPGQVKTRLASTLGYAAAVNIYRRLVEHVLHRIGSFPEVTLCFAPDDGGDECRQWQRPSWRLLPQGEGHLGRRLERAFADAFAGGARRVVVIGSDCPELTSEDIERAWSRLARHDVVLGPARDGGYWLMGLRAPCPALFRGIPWSTARVLAATLARCRRAGLRVELLQELSDVDTEADWRRFLANEHKIAKRAGGSAGAGTGAGVTRRSRFRK